MSRTDLPRPGAGTALRCHASDVELTLRSKPVLVDFSGTGTLTSKADGGAARLSGLRLVADLPDAGGPEDGGTVTLEQGGDGSDGVSTADGGDLVITLDAAVDQPGGTVRATTRDAARFSTAHAPGPSASGRYELVEPIELIMADAPEVVVARIDELVLHGEPA
ncbi:hypothetical protein AB0I60_00720 [Actinosynnema sp. NPDC050436]|uniref:hypothetical protein n=1 Tax=Actinosynnema sp. NPDC050436 TaxID=3155659 RepID=UPI0033E4A9E2